MSGDAAREGKNQFQLIPINAIINANNAKNYPKRLPKLSKNSPRCYPSSPKNSPSYPKTPQAIPRRGAYHWTRSSSCVTMNLIIMPHTKENDDEF